MYTITRGPSKLVTQRRTGPSQQLDNKINDFKHKQTSWNMPDLPAPKIVFNRLNGKRYNQPAPAALRAHALHEDDGFTPAHEQNVNFVFEAWQEVQQQQEQQQQQQEQRPSEGPEEVHGAVHYKETTPSPQMDNFVPIDLDEWWAQRFLANIDKLS